MTLQLAEVIWWQKNITVMFYTDKHFGDWKNP